MATLHVRNVPDPVYELLRQRREANGRSIGAEAVPLLQEGLAADRRAPPLPPFLGRRRRRSGPGLFSTVTERARHVVVAAQEEARALGHDHVGTEHVLLGIVAEGEGPGAKLVASIEPDAGKVWQQTLSGIVRAPTPLGLRPPVAYRVIDLEGEAADWEEQLNEACARGFDLVEVVGRRAILRRG